MEDPNKFRKALGAVKQKTAVDDLSDDEKLKFDSQKEFYDMWPIVHASKNTKLDYTCPNLYAKQHTLRHIFAKWPLSEIKRVYSYPVDFRMDIETVAYVAKYGLTENIRWLQRDCCRWDYRLVFMVICAGNRDVAKPLALHYCQLFDHPMEELKNFAERAGQAHLLD